MTEENRKIKFLKPSPVDGLITIICTFLSVFLGWLFGNSYFPKLWLWGPRLLLSKTVLGIFFVYGVVVFWRYNCRISVCQNPCYRSYQYAGLYLLLTISTEHLSIKIWEMGTDSTFINFFSKSLSYLPLFFASLALLWGITLFRQRMVTGALAMAAAINLQVLYSAHCFLPY